MREIGASSVDYDEQIGGWIAEAIKDYEHEFSHHPIAWQEVNWRIQAIETEMGTVTFPPRRQGDVVARIGIGDPDFGIFLWRLWYHPQPQGFWVKMGCRPVFYATQEKPHCTREIVRSLVFEGLTAIDTLAMQRTEAARESSV